MDVLELFSLEGEIIKQINDRPGFVSFLGTLIDDWLQSYGFQFEDGDVLLTSLIELRHDVKKLLESTDSWYCDREDKDNG